MSLTILHTSDLHLGAKLSYLGDKANEQRRAIADTFVRTVDLAIEKKFDLFLLTGDLFDTPYPSKEYIILTMEQIGRLTEAGIYTVLIPGNHDRLEAGSVYTRAEFANNRSDKFKLFTSEMHEKWYIAKLDTTVHGSAVKYQKDKKSQLTSYDRNNESKYNIGVIHGSVELRGMPDNYPIFRQDIQKLHYNYLAIGDWHSTLDVSTPGAPAWYSGSPEVLAPSQENSGNVLTITIDEETVVKPLYIAKRKTKTISLDISKFKSIHDIKKEIMPLKDLDLILLLKVRGLKPLNFEGEFEELQYMLSEYFFYLDITDETQFELTQSELDKYPEDLITGRFIRTLNEEKNKKNIDESVINEAIQLGVKLLEGSDVHN